MSRARDALAWLRSTPCFGVVLIPVSFLAFRLAANFIHPVVFTARGPQMAGSMLLVFCLMLVGLVGLAAALYRTELTGRRLDRGLPEFREQRP